MKECSSTIPILRNPATGNSFTAGLTIKTNISLFTSTFYIFFSPVKSEVVKHLL